jgi:hypothetical protein
MEGLIMNNTYIFELSRTPICFYTVSWELSHHFYHKNPYWANEGEPLDVSDRKYALECLIDELPQGYLMDPVDERIDILNPDIYLQETINRLQTTNPSLPMIYPLGWWKKEVCLFCDILIYFDEELFTLHEFLLYMISRSKDDGIRELYIGGVFEYVC